MTSGRRALRSWIVSRPVTNSPINPHGDGDRAGDPATRQRPAPGRSLHHAKPYRRDDPASSHRMEHAEPAATGIASSQPAAGLVTLFLLHVASPHAGHVTTSPGSSSSLWARRVPFASIESDISRMETPIT